MAVRTSFAPYSKHGCTPGCSRESTPARSEVRGGGSCAVNAGCAFWIGTDDHHRISFLMQRRGGLGLGSPIRISPSPFWAALSRPSPDRYSGTTKPLVGRWFQRVRCHLPTDFRYLELKTSLGTRHLEARATLDLPKARIQNGACGEGPTERVRFPGCSRSLS